MGQMKKFREISEKAGDTAVFTFGRFNPPTIGHEKLVNAVAKQQSKNSGSKMYVYASHSTDPKKNPLPYAKKIAYMRKMFKKYSRNIITGKPRTAIEVAVELYNKGHRAIVLVVGSDRVTEFRKLLEEYNGVEGKRHGYYGFDNIAVVSAGDRDPDAEGVEGMSASKMRVAAEKGDFDSFKTGIPDSMSDADKKKMYLDVRKGMGMREEREMGDDYDSLRDAYLTGKIWNVGEVVEANGVSGEVVRKGTNYLSFVAEDGKVHKAWLHEIELDERNYAKEYANYQGTPEQIARRSSRNKARRAMGDKAVKGMDVGHADNNPMNNDPKNLRMEKPSDNRREPRLREEDELDEMAWYKVALAKISQLNHPKDYEKMVKQYAADMKKPELKNKTASYIAARIANQYKGQDGRKLVQYINKLVDDGKLPKELKAEYQEEETVQTFSDLVKQINEVKQDKDIDDKDGTQPAKYYAGDMAKSTKSKRDAHFKAKKAGPAPGDADAKTKPSTHTKKFKQMFGEVLPDNADQGDYIDDFEKSDAPQFKGKSKEKRKDMAIAAYLSKNEEVELDEKIEGLVNKAEKSGMPYSILKKVYDRGMAAWKTGHRPGTTPQQWAMARVNSFVTKSSGTWGKADKDLAKQVEQIEEACWDGYKQVGMKKKGNKEVPNCVPEETELNEWGEIEEESEYQGRKVTLNKPTAGDVKKSKVYVKNEKGNVVKVEFGDPNMQIQKDIPARRKSFRARHNCDNPGPKWKARYWSCKAW